MNALREALKKSEVAGFTVASLSSVEKASVVENWDLINEDIRAKFKDIAPEETQSDEGEGGIDEKALRLLIEKSGANHVKDAAERIAAMLVDGVEKSVTEGRKAFAETGVVSATKSKEDDEVTRKFLQALKSNDTKTLKELGKRSKAITTSSEDDASAGFLIPEPLENAILRVVPAGYGLARTIFAYNLLTQGNTKRITALGSALSVFWADEGEKKPSSQPSFSLVTLALKKLVVIVPMTEEAVEDAGVDLTSLVATLIREAMDKEVDLQFFNGDGTVWTGIFQDTTLPTTELAANITIAGMRPEDIIALADDTPLGVSGSYLMHRTVLSKIRGMRENADGTGNYIFNILGASGGGSNGVYSPGTLNGFPLILSEAAPTAASATTDGNKPIMMFGDFKRAFAYGEKSGVQLKFLDQATITDVDGETVINLAEQDMVAMRAVHRVGYKATLKTAVRRLVTGD